MAKKQKSTTKHIKPKEAEDLKPSFANQAYIKGMLILIVILLIISFFCERWLRAYNFTPNSLLDFYYSALIGMFLLIFISSFLYVLMTIAITSYIQSQIAKIQNKKNSLRIFYKSMEAVPAVVGLAILFLVNIYGHISSYGYAYMIEKLAIHDKQLWVYDKVSHNSKYGSSYNYRKHIFDIHTLQRQQRTWINKNEMDNAQSTASTTNDSITWRIDNEQLIATNAKDKIIWVLSLNAQFLAIQDLYDSTGEPIFKVLENKIILAIKGYLLVIDKWNGNIKSRIRI